jgi:hypothetical protein
LKRIHLRKVCESKYIALGEMMQNREPKIHTQSGQCHDEYTSVEGICFTFCLSLVFERSEVKDVFQEAGNVPQW